MKKFILLVIMWFAAAGMMVQADAIHVSGYVTDSVTGIALPNYPVHIDIDSATGGFVYHREVHTNANGFYADTVVFNAGPALSGILKVSVWDCRMILRMEIFSFGPGHLTFTKDFHICTGTPPPPCHAEFYPSPAPPPPNPLAIHFVNISVGVNGPWQWSFGDGTNSPLFDPIHLFTAPGTYHVTLNMGDSAHGGCFNSITHEIHVGDSTGGCHAEFTWACDSTSAMRTVHFLNQSIGTSPSWFWSFGDSTFSHDQNPTHIYATNGIYHACLTVTSTSPQCTDTKCHDVPVGPPPPPGCESWFTHMANWLHVNFEGHMPSNLPATYDWTFGDGTTGTGKNIQHDFAAPGIYTVNLKTVRQDSSQCTFTSTQQIPVGDSNHIHQVYGQVLAGNFPLHHGLAMIFSDDTIPGGMPFFAMSPLDSMGVYMFPYVPNGEFVIWALPLDSAGGYLPTFYQQALFWEQATKITLGDPHNPYNINLIHTGHMPVGPGGINGNISNQGLKSATLDQIAMLLSDDQGNAIGFRRVDATGNFDFSGMDYGTYYLKPELANTSSDQVKVVLSAANPVVVVSMTYNGTNILGVTEASAVDSFVAYPNPTKDALNLNIKLESAVNATAEIYNFTGQKVLSRSLSLTKGENVIGLDISLLNSGIYTLRITSPEGIRIIQKVVKE